MGRCSVPFFVTLSDSSFQKPHWKIDAARCCSRLDSDVHSTPSALVCRTIIDTIYLTAVLKTLMTVASIHRTAVMREACRKAPLHLVCFGQGLGPKYVEWTLLVSKMTSSLGAPPLTTFFTDTSISLEISVNIRFGPPNEHDD